MAITGSRVVLLSLLFQLVNAFEDAGLPHQSHVFLAAHGNTFYFKGYATGPGSFSLSLLCDPANNGSDIPLHMDVRLNNVTGPWHVVLNARLNGLWGVEETLQFINTTPFTGFIVVFDSVIYLQPYSFIYRISVNGRHLADFSDRGSPVSCAEDVSVQGVTPVELVHVVITKDLAIPWTYQIPEKVNPVATFTFYGTPVGQDRFSFNLQCGPVFNGSDIALHMDIRLSDRRVVLNSKEGGVWGTEQIVHYFPFTLNTPFQIDIEAAVNHYEIYVNAKKYADFNYRITPSSRVNYLHVDGKFQVELQKVELTKKTAEFWRAFSA